MAIFREMKVYQGLLIIRWIWVLLGQNGYIHPDEFFQSVEIVAGDVLELNVHRTWEFNQTWPIRSAGPIHVTFGLGFWLLKLGQYLGCLSTDSDIFSYLLITIPRITMVSLSMLTDMAVYKISQRLRLDTRVVMTVYGSSYVTLVYYTRTLSNTLESFLFIALLYYVLIPSNKSSKKNPKDRQSKYVADCGVQSDSSALVIAVIIVAGVFNRPTFLIYALLPYLFWLIRDCTCGSRPASHRLKLVVAKGVQSSCAAGVVTALFIFFDSCYYGSLSVSIFDYLKQNIFSLSELFSKLTITPLNFIRYNTETKNLADHGLHPRFQHFLVNTPLLFGVVAIFPFLTLIQCVYNKLKLRTEIVQMLSSLEWLMLGTYFFSVCLLSVFPHQEPRFLIPLLVPLVLLYGNRLVGPASYRVLGVTWVIFNCLACLFYGVLHQGGLVPCLAFLQKDYANCLQNGDNITRNVVFYHTYMPPRHLLSISNKETGNQQTANCNLIVHDLKGSSFHALLETIEEISKKGSRSNHFHVSVVSPASLHHQFAQNISKPYFTAARSFGPHISTEDLPDFMNYSECRDREGDCTYLSVLKDASSSLSLTLYGVGM